MLQIGVFYRDYNKEGGIPLEYRCLVEQMYLLGHNVKIFCFGDTKEIIEVNERVKIIQIIKPEHFFKRPKSFVDYIKSNHFDVFLIVSAHMPVNYMISRVLLNNNIKYVYCVGDAYNPYLLKKKYILSKIYRRVIELKILNSADIVRTYSKTNTEFVEKYGGKVPFFELLEGIYEGDLPRDIIEYNFNNDKINVVFIGRIEYYKKGIDQLILCLKKIVNEGINIKLHIYGPFQTKQDEIKLNRDLLSFTADQVEYYGPVYGNNKFEILKGCDLFIYPSRYEGIPRSIREALFFGTPVIVTKETNFAEYVATHRAGFVCQCESGSIYDSLVQFVKCDDKQALRNNAKMLVNEFYNWDSVKSRLKLLLQRYAQ
jgi:glycosyltransferase involved in cell wall biosynthesis